MCPFLPPNLHLVLRSSIIISCSFYLEAQHSYIRWRRQDLYSFLGLHQPLLVAFVFNMRFPRLKYGAMLGELKGSSGVRAPALPHNRVLKSAPGVLGGSHRGLMELLGEVLHLCVRGLVLLRGAVSRAGHGPRGLGDGEGRDVVHRGGSHHDHA